MFDHGAGRGSPRPIRVGSVCGALRYGFSNPVRRTHATHRTVCTERSVRAQPPLELAQSVEHQTILAVAGSTPAFQRCHVKAAGKGASLRFESAPRARISPPPHPLPGAVARCGRARGVRTHDRRSSAMAGRRVARRLRRSARGASRSSLPCPAHVEASTRCVAHAAADASAPSTRDRCCGNGCTCSRRQAIEPEGSGALRSNPDRA